jgi:hypothetical protein
LVFIPSGQCKQLKITSKPKPCEPCDVYQTRCGALPVKCPYNRNGGKQLDVVDSKRFCRLDCVCDITIQNLSTTKIKMFARKMGAQREEKLDGKWKIANEQVVVVTAKHTVHPTHVFTFRNVMGNWENF